MKLGIISDVHAHIDELDEALALLDSAGAAQIICAGDLVEKGHEGDAVMRRVREREIPCVLGNHDEQAIGNQRWLRYTMDAESVAAELARLARGYNATQTALLTDETLHDLRKLPRTYQATLQEKTIFVAHGTPDSNTQYAFSHSLPTLWWHITYIAQSDVIILGHTHEPMWLCVGETTVINPGSTCCNYALHHGTCALLDLQTLHPTFLNVQDGREVPIPRLQMDDLR